MTASLEELKHRLKDLKQALSIERDHQFTDVQGRRQRFSQFVSQTLGQLRLADEQIHQQCYKLQSTFKQYNSMDVGRRMHAVDDLAELLTVLADPFSPPTVVPLLTQQDEAATAHQANGSIKPPTVVSPNTSLRKLSVSVVKGVGQRAVQLLASVGVHSVHQLLHYAPKRYIDYQTQVPIGQLQPNEDVTVIARILSVSLFQARGKPLWILTVTFGDTPARGGNRMQATWFYRNMPRNVLEGHKARYVKGAMAMVSGHTKIDKRSGNIAMERPEVELLDEDASPGESNSLHAGRIVPVYPLTEGLYLKGLRRWIWNALEQFGPAITDPFPADIRAQYPYMPLKQALHQIHFPQSMDDTEAARNRLVFDELFYLQARLAMVRARYKQTIPGLQLVKQPGGYADQFLKNLPFTLTGAQQRMFADIQRDMASNEPMYRLLQGDVGSGKTVVALLTLLIAVDSGYQGAIMAPTEILAEQHYQRFVEWLTPLGLKVGLCVGRQGVKERRIVQAGLANGQTHIAVGTHALIQDGIEFAQLGAVVIDEQHRFGVKQRILLKDKGIKNDNGETSNHPEMLTMTATPIPRTLAMTLHGDLDVSALDERPPGRQPIETMLFKGSQRKKAYQWINQELVSGRQAYVVFPLIEESETLAAKAATTEAERLQKEIFPQWRIGLMHGKLKPQEKAAVMAEFAEGRLHILVSTTVVEVGVDVPNATVMMIESADRFGLSQLHQLRGRVGRGKHKSYCLLVSDTPSEDTQQRLQVMCETDNGFIIAERDLAIRGPGEFLGTRQSGLPEFQLVDLIRDQDILVEAREAAQAVMDNGTYLLDHPELREAILENTESLFNVLGSG